VTDLEREADLAEIRMWVEQLKAARKARGWSVKRLARQMGVTTSLLRNWEGHVHRPGVPSLMAWARALGSVVQMVATDGR
jgi:transcriptional regulator with XRE-family HTH domain